MVHEASQEFPVAPWGPTSCPKQVPFSSTLTAFIDSSKAKLEQEWAGAQTAWLKHCLKEGQKIVRLNFLGVNVHFLAQPIERKLSKGLGEAGIDVQWQWAHW